MKTCLKQFTEIKNEVEYNYFKDIIELTQILMEKPMDEEIIEKIKSFREKNKHQDCDDILFDLLNYYATIARPTFRQSIIESFSQLNFKEFFITKIPKLRPNFFDYFYQKKVILFKDDDKEDEYNTNDNDMDLFITIYEPGTLKYIIKEDDIESFKNIVNNCQTEFDYGQTLEVSDNCPEYYVKMKKKEISLLSLAAFYGSIKIFNYIYINNRMELAFQDILIAPFAIAGGNLNIIHICEQNNLCNFNSCLKQSIMFHRYEVSDWLLTNYSCETISIRRTLQSYNFQAFLFFSLNEKIKTNSYDNVFFNC